MTFEEYQKQSRKTAKYPDADSNFIYPTLGLAGEAGEVSNKVKKIFRDYSGEVLPEKKEEIAAELGDVLWYVSQIATEFGLSFETIAEENIKKLHSRLERGTLGGSGDRR